MSSAPPLKDLRVLELAGLAPGPFLGLLLALYGASVLRIDRPTSNGSSRPTADLLTTHKLGSLPLDLKAPSSLSVLHSLLPSTSVLIDPFRPGVLEKLGLGADSVLQKYPQLIVVRLTGFRRDGKWKDRAGHDINYLAVGGVLSLLGSGDRPPLPPGNLLADFAGGGLMAFTGVLLALIKRGTTGKGSIVDVNMVDGASFLAVFPRLVRQTPAWSGPRGTNLLDGGCPYYGCYECKDPGRYVAVGALEPQFFNHLLEGLELQLKDVLAPGIKDRGDKAGWPHMKSIFERKFRTRSRDDWEHVFEGRDACVTPVKDMTELQDEPWTNRMPIHVKPGRGRSDLSKSTSESDSAQASIPDDAHPDDGVGWSGRGPIWTGENAEEVLDQWLGWKKGRDWDEERGAAVKLTKATASKL